MPSQYTEDESARPIGALPPSYTRCARSISMSTAPQGRNPLGKISSEKNSCIWTLHPFWKSTSLTLFRLHRSSISVIFSVSRSSWSFKIRNCSFIFARRCLNRINAVTCLLRLGNYGLKLLSSSLTDLLVASMSSRSSRNCWKQHRVHRISHCRVHNRIQSALVFFKC